MQKLGKVKYLVPTFSVDALPLIISIVVLAAGLTHAGPLTHQPPELDVGNNSLSSLPLHSGCRYQGSFYTTGEEVPTSEPCLLCECKNAVVCKLRICQEIPVPPPAGCIVVHKARKCCARLVCNNHVHETTRKISREQKLPAANTTLPTTTIDGTGYCVLDGTVYAEGSAMRSSSLCEYCFCIRGEMKCSSPQCVIPMNGCKPKFRSYACCPTNYDCQESNSSAITQTVPSSTPLPTFLKGCMVKGKRIEEGEPVLPLQLENQTDSCQTCFCMGGVIRCRPLECDRPIAGCLPLKEPGHCCPDRYDCGPRDNVTHSSSVTPTVAALTTKALQSPTSTSSPKPKSQHLPPVSSTPRELLTETTEAVSRTDPTSETTILTQSPLKQDEAVTAGPIEKLPQPARQKMTTPGVPLSTEAASSEEGFNVVLKNKSDGGSREERRNKDKHDFLPPHSFEDDEKEDSVPLSFEHQDPDPDSSSSLSYEDTTDQSSSNSEMDQDTEFSPTEENDVEAETAQSSSHSEEFSQSSSEKVSDELLSSEVLNSTGLPVEGSKEGSRKKSPAATTVVPSEKDESMGYVTTTIADTIFSSSPPVTVAPSSISTSASAMAEEENLGVTSNNGPAIAEESYITTTLPPLTKVEELETANFSSSAISELDEDSGLDAEPAATTVINQDVQSTEVSPAMSPQPSPPTSTLNPIPQVMQSVGTTVKNVQFIPFGVEDAVVSPMNDSVYEQVPPAQLAYSNHALKISLIPPTPPKGYTLRQPAGVEKTGLEVNAHAVEPPQVPALPSNVPQDDLRNAIMDVPVSTSLYSHGYYHRNGIITDDGVKESLELEVSSRRPFPGQVFDDENDSFKVGPAMPHKRIGGPSPSAQQSMSPPETLATLPPMTPTLSVSNPARTYSRFGIQDSAFYRYGLGSPGKNTAPSPPLIPAIPNHHYKIHHHQQQQQQQQGQQYNPQNNHHRYYNAPEQDRPDYHMPISEDDMAYEDDVEDDEEEISYNEQSAEDYHNPNQQHPLSSSVRTPSTPSGNLSNRDPSNIVLPSKVPLPLTTTTTMSPSTGGSAVQKVGGFSNSSSSSNNFKPAVAYPFTIPKKPPGLDFNLGLKLSGCNIYGKMYNVGDIIRELSSACIRCLCTEFGVQCTALPC